MKIHALTPHAHGDHVDGLVHIREPTIYLPSHDPGSAARFADATTSTQTPIPVA